MIDLALDEECPECSCLGVNHDELGCVYHPHCVNTCIEDTLTIMATEDFDGIEDNGIF